MPAHTKRLMFINAIGTLGYISCLAQIVWAIVPYGPGLLGTDAFRAMVPERSAESTAPSSNYISALPTEASTILLIIAVVVAVVFVVLSFIAAAKAPAAVGKTGSRLTHSTAEQVIPIITHHAKLPVKKRRMLTARVAFDIKLALVVVPLLLTLLPHSLPAVISSDLYVFLAAVIALWTLFLFCLQLALAKASRTDLTRVW